MTNLTAAMPNITLDWQECFKYHYNVDLPVKFANGTDYSVSGLYFSTGTCNEANITMNCNETSLNYNCNMTFNRDINITSLANTTMDVTLNFNATTVWSLNATLPANATDTQTFAGTQECPLCEPAIDPKPSACAKPMNVTGQPNPFYFTHAPPKDMQQIEAVDDHFLTFIQ
jgi:hypothetical protein